MKAITYHRYGTPDVLEIENVEKPVAGADDVQIRVRATEATKSDCEMRSFRFAVKWFWLPLRLAVGIRKPKRRILGGYFAGEIASVGANITTYSVGDHVFGATGLKFGAYGAYMVLPASSTIVGKPGNMSFEEAAAVPLGGLNALHFMRRAQIQPGDKVLINGAGGSIGTHAVQIAKSMGAHVTAVDSSIKEGMLGRIGADDFIDYVKQGFAAKGHTYDVILNMVAGSSYSTCIKALNSARPLSHGQPPLIGHGAFSFHKHVHQQSCQLRFCARNNRGTDHAQRHGRAGSDHNDRRQSL